MNNFYLELETRLFNILAIILELNAILFVKITKRLIRNIRIWKTS